MKNTLVVLLMIATGCSSGCATTSTSPVVAAGVTQTEACGSAQVQAAVSVALPFLSPLLVGGKLDAKGLADAEAQYGEAAVSCIATQWLDLATSTLLASLTPDAGAPIAPATAAQTLTQMAEVHKYLGSKVTLKPLAAADAGH